MTKARTVRRFTRTVMNKAIKDMKVLVAKGRSVSNARKTIGNQKHLKVTPNTIYNWERKLTGKSTQSRGLLVAPTNTILPTNGTTKPHITSVNLHVPGKGNITLDHELLSNIAQLAGHIS